MKPVRPTLLRRKRLLMLFVLACGIGASDAGAQVVRREGGAELTLEGFANLSGASVRPTGTAGSGSAAGAHADGGLRLLAGRRGADGTLGGLRLSLLSTVDRAVEIDEASAVLTGVFGRIEFGLRSGLPDILTGYAPNTFTYAGQGYGPTSLLTLFPDGGLQTAFLDDALAAGIAGQAGRGVAATGFGDFSPRAIYVTPRIEGWTAGGSFTPDADGPTRQLAILGLNRQTFHGQDNLRFGVTYTVAALGDDFRDRHSIHAGIAYTFDATLTLGAGASYDGRTGLRRDVAAGSQARGFGSVLSVDYVRGPWVLGGFLQAARSEGSPDSAGADRLFAAQIGGAYRFTTRTRIFGTVYGFDFVDEGDRTRPGAGTGVVGILGLRLTL